MLIWGLALLTSACATIGTEPIELANQIHTKVELGLIQPRQPKVITGDALGSYIPKMEALLTGKHIVIRPITEFLLTFKLGPGESLWGYYDATDRVLYVDRALQPNALFATLVHEYGHSLQPKGLGMNGQVYAEALSYFVCQKLGLDIGDASMAYMADPDFNYSDILQRYASKLMLDVNLLVGELK